MSKYDTIDNVVKDGYTYSSGDRAPPSGVGVRLHPFDCKRIKQYVFISKMSL